MSAINEYIDNQEIEIQRKLTNVMENAGNYNILTAYDYLTVKKIIRDIETLIKKDRFNFIK